VIISVVSAVRVNLVSLELLNSKTILDTDNDKKTLTAADDKRRQTKKGLVLRCCSSSSWRSSSP